MLSLLIGIAIASVVHVFEELVYPSRFLLWVHLWSPWGAPTVRQAIVLNVVFVGSVCRIALASPQTTPVLSLSVSAVCAILFRRPV